MIDLKDDAVLCARQVKLRQGYSESTGELEAWIARNTDEWKVLVSTFRTGLIALRNRTSEPEAGAVAWSWEKWIVGDHWSEHLSRTPPNHSAEKPNPCIRNFQPLYTHPAPATTDKLRVAVEALERAASVFDIYEDADEATAARQALAALNEQPQ